MCYHSITYNSTSQKPEGATPVDVYLSTMLEEKQLEFIFTFQVIFAITSAYIIAAYLLTIIDIF